MKAPCPIFSLLLAVSISSTLSLASPEAFGAESTRLPPPTTGNVDFASDIQPLFERHCYECHGGEIQRGGLRLDVRSLAFRESDSGHPVILPENSAESRLIHLVGHSDPEERMPRDGEPLSSEEIGLLRAWIDDGAPWPDELAGEEEEHWAYVKPERPDLPVVSNSAWPRNPIDAFVLSELEKEGLQPSPEAKQEQLLRRASLALTGLPPTIEEVETFLADEEPGAYERFVDRLLDSPHFGERWARPWLDYARYADTNGYEKDARRSIWPFRDWVINALNDDMSFKEFTIEQIAGDMLPEATLDQRVATGFHRNTMINTEGGTDNEEFRHAAVLDRVDTTMQVWMGVTMNCAQCHNHKYDPITIREYYEFYAFLNNTADDNRNNYKRMPVPTPEQEQTLSDLRQRISTLEQEYNATTPELKAAQAEWEKQMSSGAEIEWTPLVPSAVSSSGGAELEVLGDSSVLAGAENPANDTYTITAETSLDKITGIRLEVIPDENLPHQSLGRHPNGSFVLSAFEAEAAPAGVPGDTRAIIFESARTDYTQDGHDASSLITPGEGPGWAVGPFQDHLRVRREVVFTLGEELGYSEGARLTLRLLHESQWGKANIGRFRLSVTSAEEPAPSPDLPGEIVAILAIALAERSDEQQNKLADHYREIAPELEPLREELARLRQEEREADNAIPTTLVMEELEEPRDTHLHRRGSYLSRGEKVEPGVPAIFHPLPEGEPADRLALARWLVDRDNPLTARVTMNRIWEEYFGTGIVETSEDFGTMADAPSHPELLDWLAVEFMDRDWSLKEMHRLIVTSATFRQTTNVTPDLLEADPYNRLFTRGPRLRLEAEMIRDQALAVSGLLSREIGGPSVMPPQPEGIWNVVYSNDKWVTSEGENKYRRGIYTFYRRTSPYPSMLTFDAPSREFCVTRRSRSNTPLQALITLNDPVFVEAAQALAREVLSMAGADDTERVRYSFRRALVRSPSAEETQRVIELYNEELTHFRDHPDDAAALVFSLSDDAASNGAYGEYGEYGDYNDLPETNAAYPNGDEFPELPNGVDLYEWAAWTIVANVLLNLDEAITKG